MTFVPGRIFVGSTAGGAVLPMKIQPGKKVTTFPANADIYDLDCTVFIISCNIFIRSESSDRRSDVEQTSSLTDSSAYLSISSESPSSLSLSSDSLSLTTDSLAVIPAIPSASTENAPDAFSGAPPAKKVMLKVSGDGAWQTKGSGRSYNSKSGK